MKKTIRNMTGAVLSIVATVSLAHEGHAPVGSLNHELEHGMWLVCALILAVAVVAYRRLRK